MTYDEVLLKITELQNEVTMLRDELVRQRRQYEDELYNLDEDNFGANFKLQLDNKFSSIEQTADKISFMVQELGEYVSNNAADISSLELKSESITSTVSKIYNAVEYSDTKPNYKWDKEQMYCYNGNYYYYNDISEEWVAADSDSVISQIIQTSDGFQLRGDVKINGNVITNGTFETTEKDNLSVKIEGDKIAFRGYYTKDANGNSVNEDYFNISKGDLGYVSMNVHKACTLYVCGEGTYDFNGAKVAGLYAVFA